MNADEGVNMKTILTLDYELFFGPGVGTPQRSMIAASNKLLAVLQDYDAKAVFFVDATYLVQLKALKQDYPALQKDYDDVVGHIQYLEHEGHQIQLHIHPHWVDSLHDGQAWKLDTHRYRLMDWSQKDAAKIITDSVSELNRHLSHKVFAFRAGGWCIQPFSHIARALAENGITVDSTVFKKGRAASDTHVFDFTAAPALTHWSFTSDPCVVDTTGYFREIPISSMSISPLFFWRLAYVKLFGDKSIHGAVGDGAAIQNSHNDLLRMLTRYSDSVVSMDGYKSSCLIKEYQKAENRGDDYFVVIGHPKALSNYALDNIRQWLSVLTKEENQLCLFE